MRGPSQGAKDFVYVFVPNTYIFFDDRPIYMSRPFWTYVYVFDEMFCFLCTFTSCDG
jgi:hypothetical protein